MSFGGAGNKAAGDTGRREARKNGLVIDTAADSSPENKWLNNPFPLSARNAAAASAMQYKA